MVFLFPSLGGFAANKTLNWSQTPFCWHAWHRDGQSLDCRGGSGEGVSVAKDDPLRWRWRGPSLATETFLHKYSRDNL